MTPARRAGLSPLPLAPGRSHARRRAEFVVIASALAFFPVGLHSAAAREPWVPPASAGSLENPFQDKQVDKAAKKGKKLFAERCSVCHGPRGHGDGPGGVALDPRPADLSSESVQSQKDGEIFWKLSEGRGPMPQWKLLLSDDERWQLVSFVRTLAQ